MNILANIDSGEQQGATRLCGGERVNIDSGGYYVKPAVFDNVDPQQRIAQEEIFGPVLAVSSFNDEQQAIALANSTIYGLAAYSATHDMRRVQRLGRHVNTGLLFNNPYVAATGTPITLSIEGHKQSGNGFAAGVDGLAEYSICTAVYQMG